MDMLPEQQVQLAFARHLRDPDRVPAPQGLDPQRVATYRRLFFNNVLSLLSANYPVLSALLGSAEWSALVRRFYAEQPSHTPLFTELGQVFQQWLQALEDPPRPFAAELAHYERVEMALMLDEHEPASAPQQDSPDWWSQGVVVSPCAWLLGYRYPVHQIRAEFQPEQAPAEPTYLVVWRDRQDRIGFMALNQVSARLLELCRTQEASGHHLVAVLAAELGMPPHALQPLARQQLELWHARDILLGTRPLVGSAAAA